MDNDAAPRPRTVPLWLWIVVVPPLLYLALWGATFVLACRHVVDVRKKYESTLSPSVVLLKTFDPSAPPPMPPRSDNLRYFFIGNCRCPYPLAMSYDKVEYGKWNGGAIRIREQGWGSRWKLIDLQVHWMY